MSTLVEIVAGFISGFFGRPVTATEDSVERWRRRPFLLRWLPIFICLVLIPAAFLGVIVYLVLDAI